MGQKGHPKGFRLAVNKDWDSSWYANKANYAKYLVEDAKIRNYLNKLLRFAMVSHISIERAGNRMRVKIYTSRPGVVIGRKGQELDKIKEGIQALTDQQVLLDIQEIKKPELVAQLVAEIIAFQLERRVGFRRAMKKAMETAMTLGAEGIRIQCSGRLGGSEIARTETQREGAIPLHTLKIKIDYGFKEANTIYGKIGVKVWLCSNSQLNESK